MKVINRKPQWLKVELGTSRTFHKLKNSFLNEGLNTVCEEARCPNINECWGTYGTATFMILGDTCTRRCRFCNVKTGLPTFSDPTEPLKVARSVQKMQLKHVVITMVNRDDLEDGGAAAMAQTVRQIHELSPGCSVEVLSSDLQGDAGALATMLASEPEIMSHNLETVRRLTPLVRSASDYDRSLRFLSASKKIRPASITKSSVMLGLGETVEELEEAMDDLLAHGVELLNMGQYLQPSKLHLPVEKYWSPDEFDALKQTALAKGFRFVEAAPLVRSSYHAGAAMEFLRQATQTSADRTLRRESA